MKRKSLKSVVRTSGLVLMTLALGACSWFLDFLDSEDVGEALTIAGWEAWYAALADGNPSATVEFSGPFGGTATFEFSEADPGYSGTVTFTDFVVRASSDDGYTITGPAELFVDYNSELTDFFTNYKGTLIIAKDGGGEADYELDLGIKHTVQLPGGGIVQLDGSATGTVNNEAVGIDFSTEFAGPVPE